MVANRAKQDYSTFTDLQLWEQLTRCTANMRGYAERICKDDPSTGKLLDWAGSFYDWHLRLLNILEEAERRGLEPRRRGWLAR